MPVLVATITPLPEHRDEVRDALVEAVTAVHDEPDADLYALHENAEVFVMIEQYRDAAAVTAHGSSPALASLVKRLDGLLSGPLDVVTLEPVPAGDPAKGRLRP